MNKDQVKLGGVYLAKITDRVVPVRLDAENRHGGWDGTNLVTNKSVRIKSAQRLRGPAKGHAPAEAEQPATPAEPTTPVDAPAEPKSKGKARKSEQTTEGAKPEKGMSCLDAAAQVLRDEGKPLQCKTMVDLMHTRKLWTTDAPTPAATLYSAILREIQKKGTESRFVKTERGHFALKA